MNKKLNCFFIKIQTPSTFSISVLVILLLVSCAISCTKEKPQDSGTLGSETDINESITSKTIAASTSENLNKGSMESKGKFRFYAGYYHSLSIDNDYIISRMNIETPEPTIEKYAIIPELIDDMVYINFYYDGEFLGRDVAHGQKRYLVLGGIGFVGLYDETNRFVTGAISRGFYYVSHPSKAIASSELQEGDIIYRAENVVNRSVLQPWAVSGSGIGEKLTFMTDERYVTIFRDFVHRYNQIWISNGFVDYNKPYLYKYNNRVKKIRISRGGPDDYVDFELEDTPQLQYFPFGDELLTKNDKLIIEILEVYKGSRYDDTCINFIITGGISVDIDEE